MKHYVARLLFPGLSHKIMLKKKENLYLFRIPHYMYSKINL